MCHNFNFFSCDGTHVSDPNTVNGKIFYSIETSMNILVVNRLIIQSLKKMTVLLSKSTGSLPVEDQQNLP
jgi:hypothetical protein